MKPKEFLFKKKGSCIKGTLIGGLIDIKNRKKGIIYLSNTQLRITFKNGGERIIPLNTIKKLNLITKYWISIHTDTDESYTFGALDNTMTLYRLLSEVIANLSDGGDVQIGPKPGVEWSGIICWIIFIIASIFAAIFWIYFKDLDFSF